MKSWLNIISLLVLGIWLSLTSMGCESAFAQQNEPINSHQSLSSSKKGEYTDPGPDGNLNTFDQDPQNQPLSVLRTYWNVDGKEVQNPTHYGAVPENASAICNNGEYSFSKHRRGTCSQNGGVKVWLKDLPN